jgi:trk system potassium uptake protein TrkH
VLRALTVIALFFVAYFVATLLLALAEWVYGEQSHHFIDFLFEAMSALATDGLSTGITPSLSTAGKLVLCATMFLGRIGPLTVVVALQRRQEPPRYRYPEAPVRIG